MIHLKLILVFCAFLWRFLPWIAGLAGYMLMAPSPSRGILMASLLALAAYLLKHAAVLVSPTPSSHGTARFATNDDLVRARLTTCRGVILGRKGLRLLRYAGDGHLLTFAPTRSGKGVSCIIPNLFDYNGSVVVTDIKGENLAIAGNYRRKVGPVYELAPFGENSAKFNPFDFIRRSTPYEVDDTRLIAEMLVVTERNIPNHWEREARTLITGLILHILLECPVQDRDPAGLRAYLMEDYEGFELILARMMNSTHDVVRRIASGFSQKEDKERTAVISTAQAATEVFESPRLAEISRVSTFQFEDLKNQTASVFLVVPPEHLETYRPYMRLIIGLCTVAMTRNTSKPKHPVLFLLDELPALGYMRPIEDAIGYLAGYGAKLWLFVQDLDQLEKTYPKSRSMIANCAVRQAFNVQDPETAKLLSNMLGNATIRVRSTGGSAPLPISWLSLAFHHGNMEISRPLLTPSEVMALSPRRQLLFIQGVPGIRAQKVRYFDWWEWRFWRKKTPRP